MNLTRHCICYFMVCIIIGTLLWQNEVSKTHRQGSSVRLISWLSLTVLCSLPFQQSLNFASSLLESILLLHTYPLLHSPSFPDLIWANEMNEKVTILHFHQWLAKYLKMWCSFFLHQERLQFIEEFSKKTSLSAMLSQDTEQTAVNISEQIFSIYP